MSATLEIGTRLGGYRIEGQLGRGGMGIVFLAEHERLGRKAALKLLVPELAADEDFRARFVRESQLIAAIEHPNIIPIYDADEIDGLLYVAMRYVDGTDLKELIAQEQRLAVSHALEIVDQAGAALDAAHARDIVHRDVKPANILVDTAAARTFLTDFGIAKETRTQVTHPGQFVGTVDYAAPEQIQGEATGIPTDVYALGCVVYESLTGERAFPKDTDVAVIYAHLLEDPPRVTALRTELPPALDDVIRIALAKAPADRYPSCGEFLAALREALRTDSTIVRPRHAPRLEAAPVIRAPKAASNLPVPEGALIGRESELDGAVAALREDELRLLTLAGPGGTGKTRLAIEIASALAADFADAVYFVGLGPVNDPALVLPTVAATLGIEEHSADVLDTLGRELGEQRLLLVLDNFEHLLPASADVSALLKAAPLLKILATSRSVLRVRGEREQAIAPLQLPDEDAALVVEAVAASPAVALFVERAGDVKPGFAITADNAASVVEICRRLDGLPLAIELAAARMKLLSPQAVADRLENRLQLLTGGARDLPSRHQTLRGTIDWSYELLDPAARKLLARAAVFVGGVTLEAVEDVCAAPDLEAGSIVDALSALVDENLLRQTEGSGGEPRFAMFETIREYALFRLIESGELDELRRRHADYYVRLAEAAEPELVGAGQGAWIKTLDDEVGNVRAVMTWSLDGADVTSALRIAAALFRHWSIRGQLTEARRWFQQAVPHAGGLPAALRAKALFAAGYTALGQGDFSEAIDRFTESLASYQEVDSAAGEAASLAQLGWLKTTLGDLDAGVGHSEQSLAIARELGDTRTASLAVSNLGDAAFARDDYEGASRLYAEALSLRRAVGDRRIVADSLIKFGRARALLGSEAEAVASLDEGLAIARELDDGWTTSVALASLGFVALLRHEEARAAALLGEALAWCEKRGDKRLAAECLGGLAAVAAAQREFPRAAQLWGAEEGLRNELGAPASPVERRLLENHVDSVREALGADALRAEQETGRALDLEESMDLARSWLPSR
jgi:predicted ATPase/predicted Ser/Thr protein kinase